MGNLFAEYDNIFPLVAPVDLAGTVSSSPYVDLAGAQKCAILVSTGNINSGTATDTQVITVQAATAEDGTEAEIAFRYRTVLVGSNQWGAVTTAGTGGVTLAVTDDNINIWIEVDPDELAANDYRYVRVVSTDTPDMAACLYAAFAFLTPRYKQTTAWTATASASS